MEEDVAAAQRRETGLKNAARRRAAWPHLKAWKVSQNGNFCIKADGYRITVFKKGTGWSAVINYPLTGFEKFARRVYPSVAAAQLAAFDVLIFLQTRN
jgi:hypothetical protein